MNIEKDNKQELFNAIWENFEHFQIVTYYERISHIENYES